ncbi:TatD family hydrolase [Corynebacterium anserum]|uniref:YchF/TatD family DNA exonuclease n=1 Tax=Corynebacterium anserum TaxID=2684406 RepID=A0A7G7YPH4_9CORY|nr:TatD family hydrolase [Corynebacterium anserum]QNH96394.1 YchF/TatD family DNA exonuclease [Corynebacterium anserum]
MAKKNRPKPVPPPELRPLFDAHTHLYSTVKKMGEQVASYEEGIRALMAEADASGLVGVCTVGDGLPETEHALEAAHMHPNVWAACAIHPTLAHTLDDAAKQRLTEMSQDPRCVAIGETGLDTYWIGKDTETPSLEVQEEAFRWHIDLAVSSGKALMIHNREADEDLLRVLEDAPRPQTVILHCFSSPLEVAKEALGRGYVLSFAGNSTFKRNEELREAARIAPAGQILVETDAPYMTPEPFRGRRNAPSYVGYTAWVLAEVRGQSEREFAELVTANACRVYGIPSL